jgi:Zn-dependent membrane protease YugP
MMGFFYSGNYWLYMIPAMLIVLLANLWVNATYKKWGRVENSEGINGAEAARRLIERSGLYNISVEGTGRQLGDHYDPRTGTLRLSPGVAQERSVASIAIAAHEIGHALQHQEGYLPLRLRTAIVPLANTGSTLGWILILVGLFLRMTQLAWLGVFAFSLGAIFTLATLPVELNASKRAKALLGQAGIVGSGKDQRGVNAMLNAAAFTYVAALAASILQLLYYVSLVSGMGGRRRR